MSKGVWRVFETIEIEARGAVSTLALSRPSRHNALSRLMIDELTAACARLAEDASVRVVVLTGRGDSFCAGGDLGWMRAQMAATPQDRADGARALAAMLGALDALPKPVIGRINGQAYGGGVGLVSVCDVAVAGEDAMFGLTETRLGLIPATIGPYVVARIGAPAARRVGLSGRRFDAEEAARLGLLTAVVPSEDLDAAVEARARAFLKAAPGAVASAKALFGRLGGAPTAEAIEASVEALVARWESAEARAGVAAFFERRDPPWDT